MSTTTSPSRQNALDGVVSPVLSSRWILTWRHLAACLLFGGVFVYANCLPLLESPLWISVHQGRWILEHRTLPEIDSAQPLSVGMRVVDTAWLSQIAFGAAELVGSPAFVSDLFALFVLAYFLLLGRLFYLQTRRLGLMLLGVSLVAALGCRLETLAGPGIFGVLCFAVLLGLVRKLDASGFGPMLPPRAKENRSQRGAWPTWIATVVLFIVWANLHGSFLVGIVALACFALSRAVDVAWNSQRIRVVLADRQLRRWVLLTESAAAASLINPYGTTLLIENIRLAFHEQLREMPGQLPLSLGTLQGVLFLVSLVLLTFILRFSRRPLRTADVLLLILFGLGVVISGRALTWYAPVFAFVTMPHLADVFDRAMPSGARRVAPAKSVRLTPRSFTFTLLCLLTVYGAFTVAPIRRDVLGGEPRKLEDIHGSAALRGVTAHFRAHPPTGLVFAPIAWADWIAFEGTPNTRVFMTSNVQWAPPRVWSDHRRMSACEEGWQLGMGRYAVRTIVIDKKTQGSLGKAVRRSPKWNVVFEDGAALIAEYVDPAHSERDDKNELSVLKAES